MGEMRRKYPREFKVDAVRRVVEDGRRGTAGEHVARWDGRNARGLPAATGIYFARLEAAGTMETRKMVLLK
jgi:hypothetical protein